MADIEYIKGDATCPQGKGTKNIAHIASGTASEASMKHGSSGLPIRYEAVEKCLEKVGLKAREIEASVHMPRIGCGLTSGKWEEIEPIIQRTLCEKGVQVTVYDF